MASPWPETFMGDPFGDVGGVRFDPRKAADEISGRNPELDQVEATRLAWLEYDINQHQRQEGTSVGKKPPAPHKIVFDLETTDLDQHSGEVLEIGVMVVDKDLRPYDEGFSVVIAYSESHLSELITDEWVSKTHTDNGLISDVLSSTYTRKDAESAVIDYLSNYAAPGECVLLNNNAHFERKWFETHLPDISEFLHYRSIDVSGFAEAARYWWPELHATEPIKSQAHRALSDCRATVAQARHYRAGLMPLKEFTTDDLAGLLSAREPGRVLVPGMASASPDEAIEMGQQLIAAARLAQAHTDLLGA